MRQVVTHRCFTVRERPEKETSREKEMWMRIHADKVTREDQEADENPRMDKVPLNLRMRILAWRKFHSIGDRSEDKVKDEAEEIDKFAG